jgi:hypothetical protein
LGKASLGTLKRNLELLCNEEHPDFLAAHQLINLLGEYDFSDEKLQDNVGIRPQN